ncbi:MAG: alpha/beta hydrolase [Chloroflexota bacterium]|nr:alpha/beta hydrolase [Chloroflexota bacterium]
MFATSSDGLRIAYDRQGNGPALLLLQGFAATRQIWHELGYVEHLSQEFTVVTMDRRGIGESAMPTNPAAYHVERILGDIEVVLQACEVERYAVWGHSFGGSTALQLATRSSQVERAIIAGSFFGHVYPQERIDEIVNWLESYLEAKAQGALAELGVDAEEDAHLSQINIPAQIACWRALVNWPIVHPQDVRCPALVYAGSADERVATPLEKRRQEIEQAGIQLRFFENLDHEQEIIERKIVLEPVLAFLRG